MKNLLVLLLAVFCGLSPLQASSKKGLSKKDIPIKKCKLNRKDKRKCEVALTAIFKDEAPYLKEWIEYHRIVGVNHFYLYNNGSHDDYWEGVLKSYVEEGIVELFDVPFDSTLYNDGAKTHNFVQVTCYNHAIKQAKKANKWLAIADTDEFICPTVHKDLPDLLSHYQDPNVGAIIIYWQLYGTSWVQDILPGEAMIDKLVLRQPDSNAGLFKSIVKPRYAKAHNPHYCTLKKHKIAVTPDHRHFSHNNTYDILPVDIVRINHYTHRTMSFYENVKRPRRAQWGYTPSPEQEASDQAWANTVYDPVITRFVPELLKRLK